MSEIEKEIELKIRAQDRETILQAIKHREDDLDPLDGEGHLWWQTFRQMVLDVCPDTGLAKKKKTIEERKDSFVEKLSPHTIDYTVDMISDFLLYWTEHNEGGKKMRFEMAKNQPFNIKRRLGTWKKQQKRFGNNGSTDSNTGQVSAW